MPSSFVSSMEGQSSFFQESESSGMDLSGTLNGVIAQYFDQSLNLDGMSPSVTHKFALEHSIFLHAVLQLLAERDRVGVEANIDDPHTIKTGPLKKSSGLVRGSTWKVKYVEIRRGIFSYYENMTVSEGLMRKNIPLRSSS